MLVLSRKVGQQVQIGDQVVVTVLRVQGNTVRLGIHAADDTQILRRELDVTATTPAGQLPATAEA